MLFSVLIPNLGYHKFLEECLASVFSQKTNNLFEYEVIVCDQSDSDDYVKICSLISSLQKGTGKVIIYHQPERRVLLARHSLVQKAKGDYIVFIDSDDIVSETYLLNLFQLIRLEREPDFIIHNFKHFSNNCITEQTFPENISNNILDYFLLTDYLNPVCNKVFKRSLYSKNDYQIFDVTNGDDWILSYPMMFKAKNFFFSNNFLGYFYRSNSNSITHKISYEVALKTIEYRIPFLKGKTLNSFQDSIFTKYKIGLFSHLLSRLIVSKEDRKRVMDFIKTTRHIFFEILYSSNKGLLTKREKITFSLLKRKKYHLLLFLYQTRRFMKKQTL